MDLRSIALKNGLLKLNNLPQCQQFTNKYIQQEILTKDQLKEILETLSIVLLEPESTSTICLCFPQIILELLYRSKKRIENEKGSLYLVKHKEFCVALGKLVSQHPDVLSFALKYFDKNPAPFAIISDIEDSQPGPSKKLRLTKSSSECKVNDLDLIFTCYIFLKNSADFFREKWNWGKFIEQYLTKSEQSLEKWLAIHCMGVLTGTRSEILKQILLREFPEESYQKYEIEFLKYCSLNNVVRPSNQSDRYIEIYSPENSDYSFINHLSENVIYVSGILLPIHNRRAVQMSNLVDVPSTRSNLGKVALAVASNKAVCLQGPVGSGKTAVVEHLALLTGRTLGDEFVKVQLGDQTDARMLLGTYRCTDVPGEFVWQPGVLTQAVMEGHWILLEDIDSASMDVITLIASLLENNSLSVPGFRDSLPIIPGFQLFLTQRLLTTYSGSHKQLSHSTDKKISNIIMEPLSQSELITIVKTSFPKLNTIASRIVNVYLLFSSGFHELEVKENSSFNVENRSLSGRLISTRDLIKFCQRAIVDFNIDSNESALKVLQDGIDIFCCSVNSPELRMKQACEIAAKLGIVITQAEYFCKEYKPSISFSGSIESGALTAGRVTLERNKNQISRLTNCSFSFTRPSACLIERVACCIKYKEPVLLVGETGVGKTSSIQYLATSLRQKLVVINMNQQSDSADLLGGFKPVDLKYVMFNIREQFESLFRNTFELEPNANFLKNIEICFNNERFETFFKLMRHCIPAAIETFSAPNEHIAKTLTPVAQIERKTRREYFLQQWKEFKIQLQKLEKQLNNIKNKFIFKFVEGSLVKALENGYWVLLDEINLASAETLECLSGLLEGSNCSFSLLERGDKNLIKRHPNFTLFACMNPATDVGKKDLPAGLRNRFTEFFIEELTDKSDLLLLVKTYLNSLGLDSKRLQAIVNFYTNVRQEACKSLTDGTGHKPHFSLRTLCRALTIAAENLCGNVSRSLYEAFCLSFLTQLNAKSYSLVQRKIGKEIIGEKTLKSMLNQSIAKPNDGKQYIEFEGYWVAQGSQKPEILESYILTDSVKRNLKDLTRIVSLGKLPVLLQGDTSVGKTSLITYLAKASGNKCVRINNHEHTDLQEYVGTYVADRTGKLVFQEGVLVEAMRKGDWIILDELNLAPSDVLEALNRVLDDNRELFIPETQQTVKAHPNFMLFATQNPPGLYGGRKVLSRAFRNRFIELHFDEIPSAELQIIMGKRCDMPGSYCKKVIDVMTDLQLRRKNSAAFAGKQGFITLRDLFRWGERYRLTDINEDKFYDWKQHIAHEGYILLAGKARNQVERNEIAEVIKKHFNIAILETDLFSLHENTSLVTREILKKIEENANTYSNIVWTFNMRKLAVMVSKALQFNEPVLLVGATGGGKTTVCQILADLTQRKLYTVNCHMHSESADFVGGLRPVRDHSSTDKLFEWVDGALIKAMQEGGLFLADEISLADDSVLERLNSLLEPERTLLLAEKGAENVDENIIVANKSFSFVSTMNPGGDFGKKELSPALRNRFTEIWCDTVKIRDDLVKIIDHNLKIDQNMIIAKISGGYNSVGDAMMAIVDIFENSEVGKRYTISIRDILTWVNFINVCVTDKDMPFADAYFHGAMLTFVDRLGTGGSSSLNISAIEKEKKTLISKIEHQLRLLNFNKETLTNKLAAFSSLSKTVFMKSAGSSAQTLSIKNNTLRIFRALQLKKAILLEGSPGVGKTSIVTNLARESGNEIVRINLSDQTDISDLFGGDYPVEAGQEGEFAWRDGPFLRALKQGHWILLDELNLASQSVLEGLNACLDHRGEIFIPELGKTFQVKPDTRLFACQNPLREGGSRKGLPQSFLNRFNQVYFAPITTDDAVEIAGNLYPDISKETLKLMSEFVFRVAKDTSEKKEFGFRGGPWDFNLRDLIRWCEGLTAIQQERGYCDERWNDSRISGQDRDEADILIEKITHKRLKNKEAKEREVKRLLASNKFEMNDEGSSSAVDDMDDSENPTRSNSPALSNPDEDIVKPEKLVDLLFANRMRCVREREYLLEIFEEMCESFGLRCDLLSANSLVHVTNDYLYVGDTKSLHFNSNVDSISLHDVDVNVLRQIKPGNLLLHSHYSVLKSLLICAKLNWMAIVIGPSSVGKNCVIRALASLMGKELKIVSVNSAMDTTEILGGFEKTDYNRHLEEIASKTYRLLLATVQFCFARLGCEGSKIACNFLNDWEDYKKLSKEENVNRTDVEATTSFKTKLKKLKEIIESFQRKIPKVTFLERENLLEKIENLLRRVEAVGDLNSGGKFEWVDSTLVKCLQEGLWLLIDNVNLCSPAVLDRLNGLLEPNGELIIGERGVKESGELVKIKPHPNFRLFLALDPKNGDISRAMKNRGVEIYMMPSSSDHQSNFNELMLRSILNEIGLKNETFQQILIQSHRLIFENIIGDPPTIAQISHAGFIMAQQLERGLPTFKSIISAIDDVYINGRTFSDSISSVRNLIEETIKLYLNEARLTNKNLCLDSNNFALNTLEIRRNPAVATLKYQATLLTAIFGCLVDSDFNKSMVLNKEIQIEDILPYLIIFFYQMSEINNIEIRNSYLNYVLDEYSKRIKNQYLFNLIKETIKDLRIHFESISKIENLKRVERIRDLPIDLKWLPEVHNCLFSLSERSDFLGNSISLLIFYTVIRNVKEKSFKKIDGINFVEYSKRLSDENFRRSDSLKNVLVTNFNILIKSFESVILAICYLQSAEISNVAYNDLVLSLAWYFRFWSIGQKNVYEFKINSKTNRKDKTYNMAAIAELTLHYRWFIKYTLTTFIQVFTKKMFQCSAFRKLIAIVKEINANLKTHHDPLIKIGTQYLKKQNAPNPPFNLTQIEAESFYEKISNTISLPKNIHEDTTDRKNFERSISIAINQSEIVNTLIQIRSCKYIDNSLKIKCLVEKCENFRQKCLEKTDKNEYFDLKTIPIFHHLFSILLRNKLWLFTEDLTNELRNENIVELKNIVNFAHFVPMLPAQLIVNLELFTDEDISIGIQHEVLVEILSFIANSAALAPQNYLLAADSEIVLEKSFMHNPNLVYLIGNLVFGSDESDLVAKTTLKDYEMQNDKVKELSRLVWNNSSVISSFENDYHHCSFVAASSSFSALLRCLTDVIYKTNSLDQSFQQAPVRKSFCIDFLRQHTNDSSLDSSISKKISTICLYLEKCTHIQKSIEEVYELYESLFGYQTTSNHLLFSLSSGTMKLSLFTSYIRLVLASHLPVNDPVEKHKFKLNYLYEEKKQIEDIMDAFNVQILMLSGGNGMKHAVYDELESRKSLTDSKLESLGTATYVRPSEKWTYREVYNQVIAFRESNLKDDFHVLVEETLELIESCTNEVNKGIQATSLVRCSENVKIYRNWMRNLSHFINGLNKVHGFSDIVDPIIAAIASLLHGSEEFVTFVEKWVQQIEHYSRTNALKKSLVNFVRFPNHSVMRLKPENFLKLPLNSNELTNPEIHKLQIYRNTLSSLQDLANIFLCSKHVITSSMWKNFKVLLSHIIKTWNNREVLREKEKFEEDSLYKTINRTTGSEEEQIEIEFNETFPNYFDSDFADLTPRSLETKNEPKSIMKTEFISKFYQKIFSSNEISFIYDTHKIILKSFTKSEWLSPALNEISVPNYILPFVQKFKALNLMLNVSIKELDSQLDKTLMTSINFLLSLMRRVGDENADIDSKLFEFRSNLSKYYDFYHDSNIKETVKCRLILDDLSKRTEELLVEWPENPTLISITVIITRIQNFSLDSSVSRFLTGLEILLAKCYEWEQNAIHSVSLGLESQKITEQIIKWRALELKHWKDSLNIALEKMQTQAKKWWFFMYNIVEEFKEDNEKETVNALENFIEKSPFGEFEIRLELLYIFHCHCVQYESSDKNYLKSILWNLFQYYSQFKLLVERRIGELRTPIEKKLKDFVKIVKWNDINYWSVKETVDKTHRTLHKHIKQFEDILKQPVSQCFIANNLKTEKSNLGVWDEKNQPSTSINPSVYLASSPKAKTQWPELPEDTIVPIPLLEQLPNSNIFTDFPKYYQKSIRLTKKIMERTKYSDLVAILDESIGDIISASDHFRSLEVDRSLSKEKQKQQVKHILQVKRKALSDLFKNLTEIGFSYKSGLIQAQMIDLKSKALQMKAIDMNASVEHLKKLFIHDKCDSQLLSTWDGCEKYFLRSLARYSALETILRSPASELGVQNLNRIKGFSAMIMNSLLKQKLSLIDSTRNLYYLRCHMIELSSLFENVYFDVLKHTQKESTELSEFLIDIRNYAEQMTLYMTACPDEISDSEVLMNPSIRTSIPSKQHANYSSAMSTLASISKTAETMLEFLNQNQYTPPNVEGSHHKFHTYLTEEIIIEYSVELDDLIPFVEAIIFQFGTTPNKDPAGLEAELLLDKIKEKQSMIDRLCGSIKQAKKNNGPKRRSSEHVNENEFEFSRKLEEFIKNLLYITQGLFMKYEEVKKDETVTTESENSVFLKDHLKKHLLGNISDDLEKFNVTHILNNLSNLTSLMKSLGSDWHRCNQSLKNAFPLLNQMVHLYQFFVTHQLSVYRTTCKMSSVLNSVFLELCTNGFCLPKDLMDDEEGEGPAEGSASGMGLSDGTGEKDVSDRIESEDQLEDAKKQEEYDKQENDDSKCKEEKGIEMSENFEANLQDLENEDSDEDKPNESDGEPDVEMDKTKDGAEQLDSKVWNEEESDNEPESDHDDEEGNRGDADEGDVDDGGDNKEGKTKGEKQLGAKTGPENNEEDNETNEDQENDVNSKEKQKEINEMNEPEFDDDQINPYHGKQNPLPEPEPFDLPEEMQLDEDGEDKPEEVEESPFDIDKQKENVPKVDEKEVNQEDSQEDPSDSNQNNEDVNDEDEDDIQLRFEGETEGEDEEEKESKEQTEGKVEEDSEEKSSEKDRPNKPSMDKTSHEENIEGMEINEKQATQDNVQTNDENQSSKAETETDVDQDQNGADKDNIGQSQSESASEGHQGEFRKPDDQTKRNESDDSKQHLNKRKQPGEVDTERSMGDTKEPTLKKLKVQERQKDDDATVDDGDEKEPEQSQEANPQNHFEHVKDDKKAVTQVTDAATNEQLEQQKVANQPEEDLDDNIENSDIEMAEDEEIDAKDSNKLASEKTGNDKKKIDRENRENNQLMETDIDFEVQGEVISTLGVSRGNESTFHTKLDAIESTNSLQHLSDFEIRQLIENVLANWKETPSDEEAQKTWGMYSTLTSTLAHELCEQLRLILEPTQISRLRGDYRTGRRINMRKIIPYIASQFRKDKIWLRRTRPAKRDYQIIIAIDDSESMANNQAKELAFESLSLLSTALTLLESGQLGVVSFGETTEILHRLGDPFSDQSGAELLQKFSFSQNKTCVAKLVNFVCELFETTTGSASGPTAKLLVIVSDGRGVFYESGVQQAVRRAKDNNIFMVFVIVENPNNKDSILDLRIPFFNEKHTTRILPYMEVFPFPFYLILRDVNQLPTVLSDALRQWFELVAGSNN